MSRRNRKQSILASRRFKYGTSAVLLTVVVVAVVIIVNVIFTAFSQRYLWFIDMTEKQLFELSEPAKALLQDIEDTEIEIIFCMPFDQCEENQFTKLILTSARNFEKEFDFISVTYRDIITYPSSVEMYRTTAASKIKTTNVIITNGSDFRVFTYEAFYMFAESDGRVFGLNSELKIISAILQMQGENPIAYFTTGHGETIDNSKLWELFETAGFDVRKINLSEEEIEDNAKIVIVNGPKYDFMGAYDAESKPLPDSRNEIKKLDYFIDNFGSLMLFVDPGAQPMPELSELLSEWGIAFGDAIIKDYANSISIDGTAIVATYPTGETMGASLHKSIRELESTPKTIMRYARPIEILWTDKNSRNVSTILLSSPDAVAYSTADDEEVAKGNLNLMVLSTEMRYVQNEPMYTFVLVGGTSQFGDSVYINDNAYGNKDIMYSLMKGLGRDRVPVDIDFKTFDDNSLDITTAESARWTIFFTAALPAIVAVLGIVVYMRRRHL